MTCRDKFYNELYGWEQVASDIFHGARVVVRAFSKLLDERRAGRAFTAVSIFMAGR